MAEYRSRLAKSTSSSRKPHRRALSESQCQNVLQLLTSEKFVDCAPSEVYYQLLDQGTYLCSIRTMYRILHQHKAAQERRRQRQIPTYSAPQLVAKKPNEVWTWDITKLPRPGKFEYFHVYTVLDIYSRKVVGWLVAERESGALAEQLIASSCQREGIAPQSLTIHSDRGSAMRSKPVVALLANLGITQSLSRPHVSNDNPFIESHFKTMKYRPTFPKLFGSLEHARDFLGQFFEWYNLEHRHSGIGYMAPQAVHDGSASALRDARQVALQGAYARHPERFVRGIPTPATLPNAVWINPPPSLMPAPVGAQEITAHTIKTRPRTAA